jgi:hypothetical protein
MHGHGSVMVVGADVLVLEFLEAPGTSAIPVTQVARIRRPSSVRISTCILSRTNNFQHLQLSIESLVHHTNASPVAKDDYNTLDTMRRHAIDHARTRQYEN